MMRFIIALILSFVSIASFAQTQQTLGAPGTRIATKGDMSVDSIFYLPRTLVTSRAPSQAGALRYQASDSTLYQWTGTAWRRITSNVDTLLIATRAWRQKGDDSLGSLIAVKLNISDTSSMLSPYLRKTDTTSMLSPYVRIAGTALSKSGQTLNVDTLLVGTRAWRQKGLDSLASIELNVSDTATMLNPYVRIAGVGLSKSGQTLNNDTLVMSTRAWRQKGIDSVGALIAGAGSGTVTSVSAGTGMSFTTITTTGSVSADTVALATRAWRQKGIDSLAASEVSISDTATMLSPYNRGSGTLNFVPKYLETGRRLSNSQIFDNGTSVGIGTASPQARFHSLTSTGTAVTLGDGTSNLAIIQGASRTGTTAVSGSFANTLVLASHDDAISANTGASIGFHGKWNSGLYSSSAQFASIFGGKENSTDANLAGYLGFNTRPAGGNPTERMRLTAAGRLLVGTTTEGTNTVDIAGTLRSTQGANFATSSGNVGIGFASPTSLLHVRGSSDVATTIHNIDFGSNATPAEARLLFRGGSAIARAEIASQDRSQNIGGGHLLFRTGASTTDVMTDRMMITNTGNVGIGTTSPSSLLHVSSDASNIRKSNAAGTVYTELTNDGVIATGTSLTLFAPTSQSLIMSSGNGEAARFNANKRLLVNTTTDAGYLVDVNGTLRTVNGANFATSSGGVRIGDATAAVSTLDVQGNISATTNYRFSNNAFSQVAIQDANGAFAGGYNLTLSGANAQHAATGGISGYQLVGGTSNSTVRFIADSSRAAGTNAAIRMSILPSGNVGIGTTSPSELLDVNGRIRARTIDSTSSPINMLTSDVNGVIRKAAVPSGGGGSVTSVSAGTGMSFTTITTSGSVSVDTLSIATRARLYKTIDSMKAVGDVNVYNTNGTLTGNRTISKGGYNLTLKGDVGEFQVENAAGTSRVAVTNDGIVATGTSLTLFAPSAQPLILSSGNGEAGRFSADKEFLIGTTSDAGAFKLQVSGVTYSSDGFRTGNPNGGTAATWKLGSRVASSVALDGTQYIEVDIGGTLYYLATVSFLAPKP